MNEIESKIGLKPIINLLGENFYIPAYQRGYRWTELQVEQLLNDIWQFTLKEKEPNEFYCLQPIVVKKHQIYGWEVIDGQQRLTTIRIILNYLVQYHLKRPLNEAFEKGEYSISYQTRPDSEEFLQEIKENKTNIDFYHIWKAFEKTKNWFEVKNYNERNDFISILLAKDDKRNPVKVIWYEIEEGDDNSNDNSSIDIFTRLNIGKIPLTNAELVKALFLQKGNFHQDRATLKQLQIASEWDTIEKTLQDDSFWYFIYNPSNPIKYDTRIEYIFDLMTGKKSTHDFYHTFNSFQKVFTDSKKENGYSDVDTVWLNIKKYFLTLEEWYNNRELYHLVGYLIACGEDVNSIKLLSSDKTKSSFKESLKQVIRKHINKPIESLKYGDDLVKKVLLLFNIQTILISDKTDLRFPFNRYKEEKWDIEHVRSKTDKNISGSARREWALDLLEYFTGLRGYSDMIDTESNQSIKELQHKYIESLNNKEAEFVKDLTKIIAADKINDDQFNLIRQEIEEHFEENNMPEDIDSISNLALLDSSTNRSYKNALFPIKRKTILNNDMNGVFIPLCTKNLFLKSYSRKATDVMNWKEIDAQDYLSIIKSTLKNYLN